MNASKPAIALVIVAGAVVVAVVAAGRLKAEHDEVIQAVEDIEARFTALDPVERVAVLARLSVLAVRRVKERRA